MVSFGDFSKLDIRVGKILEAQIHPQADKLYILKVDIGEKIIQLVAGIRASYNPEELKDKLIVVVVNLEPRNIRGCLSEGMLLAAQTDNRISLIGPYESIEAGSKVK